MYNFHKYYIGDIGQIRRGIVCNVESDFATIELSKYDKGIMNKVDFPHPLEIGEEIRVIIAYAALKYFTVELMDKKLG